MLERLVGQWEFELVPGGRVAATGHVDARMDESRTFLVWTAEGSVGADAPREWHENWPTRSDFIVGFDDASGAMTALTSDIRGVHRIYEMSLTDSEWRIWRNAPGFHQRFLGRFDAAGDTIESLWEKSEDGVAWTTDFEGTYRRQT
jgi:hypothetical protein